MQLTLEDFHHEFLQALQAQGYEAMRVCGASGLCAIKQFNFTWGVVVGMDPLSHDRRYCYERRDEAVEALAAWDGTDHLAGPWIKCKGSTIDLLNPALCV
jgi:hypothetical protein